MIYKPFWRFLKVPQLAWPYKSGPTMNNILQQLGRMLNEERWGAYNKLEKLHHSFFPIISATLVTPHASVRMLVVRGRAHWQLLSAAPRSGRPSVWICACGYQHSHVALQWTGKGTLAPELQTNTCFCLKEGCESTTSMHNNSVSSSRQNKKPIGPVLTKYWEHL